ncbi:MAG: Spy/CpxP family protein refolding chaperone [Bdellovibrionales bacterium]|nr:Spy/CpxP family protein refolding chaperone [Bdellovibrionales bacterium]
MNNSKTIITVMMGALLLSADPALAKRGGARMAEELGLSQEQKDKMKEMREKSREQHQARRDSMQTAREELEKALQSDATEKQLRAKFESLEKLQREFARERFEHVLAVRAILTPEQRTKFRGMMGGGDRGGWRKEHRKGKWRDDGEE